MSFGESVTPAPRQVVLPVLRPGMTDLTILGYPVETVLAEKIVTAVDLCPASTRVRDVADIDSITGAHDLSLDGVRAPSEVTHRSIVSTVSTGTPPI